LANALRVKPATVGTFTVTELTNGLDDVGVVQALAAAGVEADPLSISSRGSERKHGLLLGHAIAGPEQIRHGVDIIERVICGMTRGAS
jgi:DNA-binding transcriptional MocR family regulator